MSRLICSATLLLGLFLGVSSAESAVDRDTIQIGLASWYGSEWRVTASGERYDPASLTAAHRTLPFNTFVRVTHRKTGRSTVVRINNRGPFKKGRVIDLSKAAAGELRMIGSGVAPVEVAVLVPAVEQAQNATSRPALAIGPSGAVPR